LPLIVVWYGDIFGRRGRPVRLQSRVNEVRQAAPHSSLGCRQGASGKPMKRVSAVESQDSESASLPGSVTPNRQQAARIDER